MPTPKPPTLAQIAEAIAAELDAAIPFDENPKGLRDPLGLTKTLCV